MSFWPSFILEFFQNSNLSKGCQWKSITCFMMRQAPLECDNFSSFLVARLVHYSCIKSPWTRYTTIVGTTHLAPSFLVYLKWQDSWRTVRPLTDSSNLFIRWHILTIAINCRLRTPRETAVGRGPLRSGSRNRRRHGGRGLRYRPHRRWRGIIYQRWMVSMIGLI